MYLVVSFTCLCINCLLLVLYLPYMHVPCANDQYNYNDCLIIGGPPTDPVKKKKSKMDRSKRQRDGK